MEVQVTFNCMRACATERTFNCMRASMTETMKETTRLRRLASLGRGCYRSKTEKGKPWLQNRFFFFFDFLWIELQDYKVNSMGQRAADAETSLILQFYPTLDKKKAKKKGLSCSQIFQNQR